MRMIKLDFTYADFTGDQFKKIQGCISFSYKHEIVVVLFPAAVPEAHTIYCKSNSWKRVEQADINITDQEFATIQTFFYFGLNKSNHLFLMLIQIDRAANKNQNDDSQQDGENP